MPCGCKKGSGVSFRGGGMSFRGGGMKKKRRKRKKKGGALIGADPRTWAPKGSGFIRNMFRNRPRFGTRYVSKNPSLYKRGSGMGFSGAGMAFHGAGLRTGRLFLRRGTGRRMI